jgi:GTP cyclohydrolase I
LKHTNTKTYRLLQVQERLTGQISASLEEQMNPLGVMVFIEATHMCMQMRGVRETAATTVTTSTKGLFSGASAEARGLRAEFMRLVGK